MVRASLGILATRGNNRYHLTDERRGVAPSASIFTLPTNESCMSLEEFGAHLRKQREQRKLTLTNISEATRINDFSRQSKGEKSPLFHRHTSERSSEPMHGRLTLIPKKLSVSTMRRIKRTRPRQRIRLHARNKNQSVRSTSANPSIFPTPDFFRATFPSLHSPSSSSRQSSISPIRGVISPRREILWKFPLTRSFKSRKRLW